MSSRPPFPSLAFARGEGTPGTSNCAGTPFVQSARLPLNPTLPYRARTRRDRTIDLHLKFGHPVRTTPQWPSLPEMRFRLRFLTEEFFETLEAYFGKRHLLAQAKTLVWRAIDCFEPENPDFPAFIDGLEDLQVFAEGTTIVCGTNSAPIEREVHRANMTKERPKDATTKFVKPEGWTPPDIAGELRKQGWEG